MWFPRITSIFKIKATKKKESKKESEKASKKERATCIFACVSAPSTVCVCLKGPNCC